MTTMKSTSDKLAIDGGTPALDRDLNTYFGASIIGDEEKQAVMDVLDSQSLFRYYGPQLLSKVATFEADFAEFIGSKYALATGSGTAAERSSCLRAFARRRSDADFSCPQAAMMSRPRGVRTGLE